MNIKNILVGTVVSAVMFGAMAIPALATSPSTTDLSANNWRVFNINTAGTKWAINKAQPLDGGGVEFTFNQTATGWYTPYLKTGYNVDLTGKTITAKISWTTSALYMNRKGIPNDAQVRLVFISANGNWGPNDYWWSTQSLDLNAVSSGTLVASLADRTLWTNMGGKSATDDITENWTYEGDIVAMSPFDGFTKAMKNVKEVGLSFGRLGSYASGVAVTGDTEATFQLNTFTVAPTVPPAT